MTRRVCIGRFPDGFTMGLLISAPANDVLLTNPLDGNKMTFNSSWTDMLKVHVIGYGFYAATLIKVLWPNLGYMPFMEIRSADASTGAIFDDTFSGSVVGPGAVISSDGFIPTQSTGFTFTYLYVTYKLPAPSQ